nr:hypothetical protein [Stenotrophomonas maltophilia]
MHIPTPQQPAPPAANPGGTGAQTVGSTELASFISRDSYDGIGGALRGLAAGKPRAIGGDAIAVLVSSAVTALETDLHTARESVQAKDAKIDVLREELSTLKSKNSTLAEKVDSLEKMNAMTQVGMTIASILVGVSVDAFKSSTKPLAIVTGLLAIVLLVSGWVIPRIKGKKNV